ncbi:hypothetical protein Tco_0755889 [Tanacetum coccineum]
MCLLYEESCSTMADNVQVNRMNVDYAALLWWDFMNNVFQKKDVIQYPRFTKLIIADLIKKYPSISPRLEEDYHSIKYDIPLVSVYTTRNVQVRGMLIPNALLTEKIHATNDHKESIPRAHRTPTLTATSPQGKKRKQSDGETSSPQKSLKVTIKHKQVVEGENDVESYVDEFVDSMLNDDVDDSDESKVDNVRGKTVMNEQMQTPIPTPTRSPRKYLSSDKIILEVLTAPVSPTTATTSKTKSKKGFTSNKTKKVHGKVDQVLHEIIPQLAERATNDLIESNLKRIVADTIIQERDAFQDVVSALISKEFDA